MPIFEAWECERELPLIEPGMTAFPLTNEELEKLSEFQTRMVNNVTKIGKELIETFKASLAEDARTGKFSDDNQFPDFAGTQLMQNYLQSFQVDPYNKTLTENINALLKQSYNGLIPRVAITCTPDLTLKATGMLLEDRLRQHCDKRTNEDVKELCKNASKEELYRVIANNVFPPNIISLANSELLERDKQKIKELQAYYSPEKIKELREAIDVAKKKGSILNTGSLLQMDVSDPKLQESLQHFEEWKKVEEQERNKQIFSDSFNLLTQIGTVTGCKEIAMLGVVGNMGIQLHTAVTALAALPAGASMASMLTPMTAIASVAISLYSMFQEPEDDNSMQLMFEQLFQQLQQISEQIKNLHLDMRKHFEIVFIALNNIIQDLKKHHYELVNISNQIQDLHTSVSKYNANAEYFLQSTYLQKIRSNLYTITKSNSILLSSGNKFHSVFMNMLESLEEYSFDRGCNAHIKAIDTKNSNATLFPASNVIEVLSAPVHYRLGYLAAILGFDNADKMMVPDLFVDNAEGLHLLIKRWLPYYDGLTVDNFPQTICNIIAKARLTEQFIAESRSAINNFVQAYQQNIRNLTTIIVNWRNTNQEKFKVDCMQTLEQLQEQGDLWNGRTQVPPTGYNNSPWNALPIEYVQKVIELSPNVMRMLKYASLLEKLDVGKITISFSAPCSAPPDFNCSCYVSGNFSINFTYNSNNKQISIAEHSWSMHRILHPDTEWNWAGMRVGLPQYIDSWNHNIKKPVFNENIEEELRNAALNRLHEIRAELTNVQNSFGIEVDKICSEIQKNYTIIKSLYQLHDVGLIAICGNSIRKDLLNRFVSDGGMTTDNLLDDLNRIITNAHHVFGIPFPEENSTIVAIRETIEKLSALPAMVVQIKTKYRRTKEIKENLKTDIAAEKQRIEVIQKEIINRKIDKIAYLEGMIRTKELITSNFITMGKLSEANLLAQLSYGLPGDIDVEMEVTQQFKTAFISGSSFALNDAARLLMRNHYGDSAQFILDEGVKILSKMTNDTNFLELASTKQKSIAIAQNQLNHEQNLVKGFTPSFQNNQYCSFFDTAKTNNDYDWYDVGANGNCLFLSIAHQLNTRNIEQNIDHQTVRHAIAEHINDHWDKYNEFVTDQDLVRAGLPNNTSAVNLTNEEKQKYIAKLKEDGFWGDHVSIQSAMEVYKVNIIVKSRIDSLHDRNEYVNNARGTIYIGHIAELHYQSLFLKTENIMNNNNRNKSTHQQAFRLC